MSAASWGSADRTRSARPAARGRLGVRLLKPPGPSAPGSAQTRPEPWFAVPRGAASAGPARAPWLSPAAWAGVGKSARSCPAGRAACLLPASGFPVSPSSLGVLPDVPEGVVFVLVSKGRVGLWAVRSVRGDRPVSTPPLPRPLALRGAVCSLRDSSQVSSGFCDPGATWEVSLTASVCWDIETRNVPCRRPESFRGRRLVHSAVSVRAAVTAKHGD